MRARPGNCVNFAACYINRVLVFLGIAWNTFFSSFPLKYMNYLPRLKWRKKLDSIVHLGLFRCWSKRLNWRFDFYICLWANKEKFNVIFQSFWETSRFFFHFILFKWQHRKCFVYSSETFDFKVPAEISATNFE